MITLPVKHVHQHPCALCASTPTHWVKELIPGAKGDMSQSYTGSYYLCVPCLEVADKHGAVARLQQFRSRKDHYVIVKAKTFAFLNAGKRGHI